MNHKNIAALIAVFLLFLAVSAINAETGLSGSGKIYARFPHCRDYVRPESGLIIPKDTIVTVKPDVYAPMATDSVLVGASLTVVLYPGAAVRVLDDALVPLTGRIGVAVEAADRHFSVRHRRFLLQIEKGRLLVEITPDNGAFLLMPDNGLAIVKDDARTVTELEAGQQIHFPLFGPAKLSSRPSGFWQLPPSGFSMVRIALPTTAEESDEESEDQTETADIATVSVTLPADEKPLNEPAAATGSSQIPIAGQTASTPEQKAP